MASASHTCLGSLPPPHSQVGPSACAAPHAGPFPNPPGAPARWPPAVAPRRSSCPAPAPGRRPAPRPPPAGTRSSTRPWYPATCLWTGRCWSGAFHGLRRLPRPRVSAALQGGSRDSPGVGAAELAQVRPELGFGQDQTGVTGIQLGPAAGVPGVRRLGSPSDGGPMSTATASTSSASPMALENL